MKNMKCFILTIIILTGCASNKNKNKVKKCHPRFEAQVQQCIKVYGDDEYIKERCKKQMEDFYCK